MATADDRTPDDTPHEDWTDQQQEAHFALHDARPGDYVLWADRSVAMEVAEVGATEDGLRYIEAEKPRGDGTYRVTEGYSQGKPKYTSPIGRANNLHFVERTDPPRTLDEREYEALVERQTENAIDAFMRLDYGEWEDAVEEVVDTWGEEVAFEDWRGYKHHPDWEAGDAEAIFESVVEHADPVPPETADTLREEAEAVLFTAVYGSGRDRAEAELIAAPDDYDETVETLAHHTLDRYDRKSYPSARLAVRDTISNWADDRGEAALQSVIEYGNDRFDDDLYAETDPDELAREKAFDILDTEVWEQVQRMQRDRGEHDPTIRGLTYEGYYDLVDHLGARTARQYNGDGLLRTEAKKTVAEWADAVERHEWAGHRHRIYAEGDVEDIFSSVAIHADADPTVFNPFSRNKERKLAIQALVPDVLKSAESIIDERGEPEVAYDADSFLQNRLNMGDATFSELHQANEAEVTEFFDRALGSATGDEVGWTFAEEIIEAGGTIPESTNDWLLIDYGIVRVDDTLRRLAWFDRETGALLILSGRVEEEVVDGLRVWDEDTDFYVQRIEFGADQPEYLLTDVPLDEALDFVYDYVEADQADVRIVETHDDIMVGDAISDDDINATGVIDALVPNISLGVDDVATITRTSASSASGFLKRHWAELTGIGALAALMTGRFYLGTALVGSNLRPSVHKSKGVGIKGSKELGAGKGQSGVGGEVDTELYVRNETFRNLVDERAPEFVRYGLREGDIGKGAVISAGESLDSVRYALSNTEENPDYDPVADEVSPDDISDMTDEEVADVARRSNRDFEGEGMLDDIDLLRSKLPGYLRYANEDEERYETVSWGQAFLDTYGGSVERLEAVFRRGGKDALAEEEAKREFGDTQTVATTADVDDELVEMAAEEEPDVIDPDDFSWDDLRKTEVGISGLMLRGLEAEDVVAGAEFLNVEDWLNDTAGRVVQRGSEFVDREKPTFEEWQQQRFGPGRPSGPEEEAARRARYHKEVAGAGEAPDPSDVLGLDEDVQGAISDEPDDLGDYNNSSYLDEFGNAFEEVADRFRSGEPAEPDAELEDGHE